MIGLQRQDSGKLFAQVACQLVLFLVRPVYFSHWRATFLVYSAATVLGSGVVCACEKCLVCARQRLFVCARYLSVILSLYLFNMNLLVDVSALHHHTTHHCVGFFVTSLCGVFVFRSQHLYIEKYMAHI